jgi:isopentenyl-diphosphate delta-isomerase
MSNFNDLDQRKKDHLQMAISAQVDSSQIDHRFFYEPLFSSHPGPGEGLTPFTFLGKKMMAPFWVSSMTGGTNSAGKINKNLAQAVAEFGMGMGLGSCRPLLDSNKYFEDFNLRPILGEDRPFFANLGIAQIEKLVEEQQVIKVAHLVESLRADGLIIHINPLQEWLQPEGDRLKRPAIDSLRDFLKEFPFKVVVKEVGQGMGPLSLKALMELPLAAIEFGAFGGTNFSKLEILRGKKEYLYDLVQVGHQPEEMIKIVKNLMDEMGDLAQCREFIISGGVNSFTQAYYLRESFGPSSVVGMARSFLEKANLDYAHLQKYVAELIEGYGLCERFLKVKG